MGPAEGNYELCIEALKEQYLDEDFIVDEYFRLICSESPEYDESYTKTRVYIANVRNHLHNLKTHYNIDLVDKDSGGHKFLSHIIFSKFSIELRQAFSRECKSDYPTFSQILDTYSKVINSLIRNRRKKSAQKPPPKSGNFSKPWQNKNPNDNTPTLNFAVAEASKPIILHCRFCNIDGHSNVGCPNFVSHDARVKKCKDFLKMLVFKQTYH